VGVAGELGGIAANSPNIRLSTLTQICVVLARYLWTFFRHGTEIGEREKKKKI